MFDPKKMGVAIALKLKPKDDAGAEEESEVGSLEACAQDLIVGIKQDDPKAVESALRAAFEVLESEPHEEGPPVDESEEEVPNG